MNKSLSMKKYIPKIDNLLFNLNFIKKLNYTKKYFINYNFFFQKSLLYIYLQYIL